MTLMLPLLLQDDEKGAESVKVDLSAEDDDIARLEAFAEGLVNKV